MIGDGFAVLLFASTFLAGSLSTWDLVMIHRRETAPRNLITRAFVVVSSVVTLAAGFFGFLAARRLLGYEPLPGGALASVVVASAVLLLPVFLRVTVGQIRGRP